MHLRQTFIITLVLRLSNYSCLNFCHILFTRSLWILKSRGSLSRKRSSVYGNRWTGAAAWIKRNVAQLHFTTNHFFFWFSRNWLDFINWTTPDLFIQYCLHNLKILMTWLILLDIIRSFNWTASICPSLKLLPGGCRLYLKSISL